MEIELPSNWPPRCGAASCPPSRRWTPRWSAPTPSRHVNPFALRLDERARAAAAAADAQLARGEGGPLCGVPVTVKDSHWLAGVPTTFGSQRRRAADPGRDRRRRARGSRTPAR